MAYTPKLSFVDWTRINIWCCDQFFTPNEISIHTEKVHAEQKRDQVKNNKSMTETEGMNSVYSKFENNNQIPETNTANENPCDVCLKSFKHEYSLKRHKRKNICEVNNIHSESPKISKNYEVAKVNKPDKNIGAITKNKFAEDETKTPGSATKDKRTTPARRFVWTSWKADTEMLPEGWTKRSQVNAKDVRVYQFRNNGKKPGKILQSKKEVFAFVKNSKTCSLDDALKFLYVVKKQENYEEASDNRKEDVQYEFDCNYCPQQFCTLNEKENHQQQEHAGQIRYKCNECGTGDLKKNSLFYHIQTKHSDVQRSDQVTFNAQVPERMEILNSTRKSTPQDEQESDLEIDQGGNAKYYNKVIKMNAETEAKEASPKKIEEIILDDSEEEPDSDLSPEELKSCEICDFPFTSSQNALVHFYSDHLEEIDVIWKDLIGIEAGKHVCKLCGHEEEYIDKNTIKLHIFNNHSDDFEKIVSSTGYFSSCMLKLLMIKLPVELVNGLDETVLDKNIENHCEDRLEDTSSCNNNQENAYKDYSDHYLDENSQETNFDEDIEFVESLSKQDWVVDPTLPEGWKRRPLPDHSKQRKKDESMVVKKYQYMSPDGLVFDSRKKIFEYMDINTHIPNQDQILNWQLPVDYEQEGDIEDKQSEMDECGSQLSNRDQDDELTSFGDDTQVPVQESGEGRQGRCEGDGQSGPEEISE